MDNMIWWAGGILLVIIVWVLTHPQGGYGGHAPHNQVNDPGGEIATYGIGARGGFGVGAPGAPDESDTEYLIRDNFGRLVGVQRQKTGKGNNAQAQPANGGPAGNNGGNPVPNPAPAPAPAAGTNGGPAAP